MAPALSQIVVDNASRDDTAARVSQRPGVEVIANASNRGFAAAANQGPGGRSKITLRNAASFAESRRLPSPTADVDRLTSEGPGYRIAAGELVDLKGKPQEGFTIRRFPTPSALVLELLGINRLWPSNPVNRRYRYFDRDLSQAGPVEQPAGAFLMIGAEAWKRLGGFDERFTPVWFEDVDFCRRAADSGIRIDYIPSVRATHEGGHSVGKLSPGCRAIYWCVSLLRYAAKHFRPLWDIGASVRLRCSALVSAGGRGDDQERSLVSLAAYFRIARLAGPVPPVTAGFPAQFGRDPELN